MGKKAFVEGALTGLLQSAGQDVALELSGDEETVTIFFWATGYRKKVNIAADSHLAIVKDVIQKVMY
jgi:hypothetical protein